MKRTSCTTIRRTALAPNLGRANILQATALKDSPEPGLVSVSRGGGLINAFSRGGLHGNNKLLCIRPQHMSPAPRSATSNRLMLP